MTIKLSRRVHDGTIVGNWGGYLVPYNPRVMRQPPVGVFQVRRWTRGFDLEGNPVEVVSPMMIAKAGFAEVKGIK